jgi:hypothetical protein
MIFGISYFKCDKCGKRFCSLSAEWCTTAFIAPMQCTDCGSMHTYPIQLMNLGGILGPGPIYRKIWEINDKEANAGTQ